MLFLCIVCLYLSDANAVVDYLAFYTDGIEIPQGTITGAINWYGNYRKFLGIPYATVVDRFQVSFIYLIFL